MALSPTCPEHVGDTYCLFHRVKCFGDGRITKGRSEHGILVVVPSRVPDGEDDVIQGLNQSSVIVDLDGLVDMRGGKSSV